MSDLIALHQLRPGQAGIIVRVGGQAALRRRYLEMGLVRGETVSLTRVAPLGDPMAYQVKGYHLALRREEASQIWVRVLNPEAAE